MRAGTYEEVAPVVLQSPEDPEPHRGADEEGNVLVHAFHRRRVEATIRQLGVEALVGCVVITSHVLFFFQLLIPANNQLTRVSSTETVSKQLCERL